MRALTDRQAPPRAKGEPSPGFRVAVFVGLTALGVAAVGAVDHAQPMSKHLIASLSVGIIIAAAVFSVTSMRRNAATAALIVGLVFGGLMYSQAAQDWAAAGWAHASAWISAHHPHSGGGSGG